MLILGVGGELFKGDSIIRRMQNVHSMLLAVLAVGLLVISACDEDEGGCCQHENRDPDTGLWLDCRDDWSKEECEERNGPEYTGDWYWREGMTCDEAKNSPPY